MLVAGLAAAVLLVACSSGHGRSTPATTLPPGTITVDRWNPPVLTGGPTTANFCAALTAIYQHTADLSHVVSKKVSTDILSDYIRYAPTLIAQSPEPVHDSTAVYIGAVAAYLQKLVTAGLDLSRLPPGALGALGTSPVKAAYSSLSGYSQTECHYTIGGTSTAS